MSRLWCAAREFKIRHSRFGAGGIPPTLPSKLSYRQYGFLFCRAESTRLSSSQATAQRDLVGYNMYEHDKANIRPPLEADQQASLCVDISKRVRMLYPTGISFEEMVPKTEVEWGHSPEHTTPDDVLNKITTTNLPIPPDDVAQGGNPPLTEWWFLLEAMNSGCNEIFRVQLVGSRANNRRDTSWHGPRSSTSALPFFHRDPVFICIDLEKNCANAFTKPGETSRISEFGLNRPDTRDLGP